jgi:hypothetical protein
MMSASVPRIPGWGNGDAPARRGAPGRSPFHAGGLRAPCVSRREVAGRADSPGQHAGTARGLPPESPGPSRFRGRLPLLPRASPLPTGRDIPVAHCVLQSVRGSQAPAAGLDGTVRSDADQREHEGGSPRARDHADAPLPFCTPGRRVRQRGGRRSLQVPRSWGNVGPPRRIATPWLPLPQRHRRPVGRRKEHVCNSIAQELTSQVRPETVPQVRRASARTSAPIGQCPASRPTAMSPSLSQAWRKPGR